MTAIVQECCELYWTSPRGSIPQSSCCADTFHPSRKLSKLDEWDMRYTAGEVRVSDVLPWTTSHGRVRVGRPARTYLRQPDTGYSMEDLLRAIEDKDEWRERIREIRASSTPWYEEKYLLTATTTIIMVIIIIEMKQLIA